MKVLEDIEEMEGIEVLEEMEVIEAIDEMEIAVSCGKWRNIKRWIF